MQYDALAVYSGDTVTCTCGSPVQTIGSGYILCPDCLYVDLDPVVEYDPRFRFFIRR